VNRFAPSGWAFSGKLFREKFPEIIEKNPVTMKILSPKMTRLLENISPLIPQLSGFPPTLPPYHVLTAYAR
jgi:hypothetical protein